MKEKNIARNSLAQRMKTSRSQIGRVLDPTDGNVTLATLQRAARMVGRSLRLELVREDRVAAANFGPSSQSLSAAIASVACRSGKESASRSRS